MVCLRNLKMQGKTPKMSCNQIKALIIAICFLPLPAYAEMNDTTLITKAEAGDAVSQIELIKNYTFGYGGARKNDAEAIKWLNIVIQNKNCSLVCNQAYVQLGRRYELGEGFPQDYTKAIEYYKIASSKNFPMGARLAHLYAEGKGTAQNYEEAYYQISTVVGKNELGDNNDFKNKLKSLISPAKAKEIDARVEKEREASKNAYTQHTYANPIASIAVNINSESMSSADKNGLELLKLAALPSKPDGLSLAKQYIEAGAKLNIKDSSGETPLIAAVKSGKLDLVEILINAGVDLNESSANGMSPLAWAVNYNQADIVDMLLKHKANPQQIDAVGLFPLSLAASKGNVRMIKSLVSNGADINFHGIDNKEYTPLIEATILGKVEAVQCLISLGADINITMDKDKYGNGNTNALFFAHKYKQEQIVRILEAAGSK